MPTAFTGLTIEYSVAQRCNECGRPIVNAGTLAVCKQRGTQGQLGTLYYHKECLYKKTMHSAIPNKNCICGVCKHKEGLDFTFDHSDFSSGREHKNGYHKACVDSFLQSNEHKFNVTDEVFGKVIANFDTDKNVSKIKSLTQLDYLFTKIDESDALKKCLSSSRLAKERYIYNGPGMSGGPKGNLREQYIRGLFKEILTREAENFKEWLKPNSKVKKNKSKYSAWDVKKVVRIQAVEQWKELSTELRDAAILLFVTDLSPECIEEEWSRLTEETKINFCKNGKITFDFYEKFLAQVPDLIPLLKENSGIDERVKLVLNEEENVLSKSW